MDSTSTVSRSSRLPRWPGYLLAAYAIVIGVLASLAAKTYPAGWGVLTRPLLGVWAVAGGLLLLLGDPWWKPLLRLWALAQTVVIIVDPSGELTRQPGLWLGVVNSSSMSSNDQLIEAQGWGVNFMGLILLVLIQWIIVRKWHPLVPERLWEFQVLRMVRMLFLGVNLLVLAYEGWHLGPYFTEKNRLMVIDCPFPGAEVYLKDCKLGSTPLVITHDNLVSWDLSKPSGAHRCQIAPTGWDEGLALSGNSGAATLLLSPPWWCRGSFATWPSEWGPRVVPQDLRLGSNHCWLWIVSKAQPGLVLSMPESGPAAVKAGQAVEFTLALRKNPPDPRMIKPAEAKGASSAGLTVTLVRGSGYETKKIPLPAEWVNLAVGAELKHTFQVPAPQIPGQYNYRISYGLYGGTNNTQRLDYGSARTYGVVEGK